MKKTIKKTKYIDIRTDTVEGVAKVERLMVRGWRIIRNGLFFVTLANK